MMPVEDNVKQDVGYYVRKLGVQFTPILNTAELAIKNYSAEPKKEADAIKRTYRENTERIPLEILGEFGYVPLFKDVRKVVLDDIYKGLRKQQKLDEKKLRDVDGNIIKEKDITEAEMKKYQPERYMVEYGVGSAKYYQKQVAKERNARKKAIKADRLRAKYGY
jgi:hypothetical protein